MSTGPTPAATFRERLWPSWWIWLAVLGAAGSLGLVAARFSGVAGALVATLSAAALTALIALGTPLLAVTRDCLVAGRARIPLTLLSAANPLDREQMRSARGPNLDARAYLCLRGWISDGVLVRIQDPHDPTPYWLLSSRRPEELAAAITAGIDRSRARG